MLKAIGLIQMAIAPVFVLPALTGQDQVAGDLDRQLEATLQSIEYLGDLRSNIQLGEAQALRALDRATEPAREQSLQREAHLEVLRDDLAQLRYSLDRLLADPREVAAITSMPPSVVRALGLGGRPKDATENTASTPGPTVDQTNTAGAPAGVGATNPNGTEPRGAQPNQPSPADRVGIMPGVEMRPPELRGTEPLAPSGPTAGTGRNGDGRSTSLVGGAPTTTGIDSTMRMGIEGDIAPLDGVRPTSRRRGTEPVPLESEGYIADRTRLGRLLVRSGRTAEAIELLEGESASPDARYWLARAFEDAERLEEALDIYREIAADESLGTVSRHAKHDLEFLEFRRALKLRR